MYKNANYRDNRKVEYLMLKQKELKRVTSNPFLSKKEKVKKDLARMQ